MESNQQKPKDNSVFKQVGRWFSKKAVGNSNSGSNGNDASNIAS